MSALRTTRLTLPTAGLGTENPLPPLEHVPDLHAGLELAGVDDEMCRNLAYGHCRSVLPYLVQDDYGRALTDTAHPVAVLENDHLRATFLMGHGGRLWSLVDRESDRELLYRNPALQPANLAVRGAWFAGGVEWNIGMTGHTPMTCAPLHAARVLLDDGTPVLRMYELERVRGVVFQVDAWLPADSQVLLVHVRIVNPHDTEIPIYWWSNIAVPQSDGVRVLVDSTAAWRFDYGTAVRRVPAPVHEGVDRSYPARSCAAADYFYDLGSAERPWIAAVDEHGVGLVQTSTRELRGRKLFMWGDSPGGRHWQEWLSPAGGTYLEIQAGLARTQLEHLPMPPRAHWSWLETYGPLDLDPRVAHGDWEAAVAAASAELDGRAPQHRLARWAAQGRAFADQPPTEVLHDGSGWGALERRRQAADGGGFVGPGTPFPDHTLGALQQPWLDLLDGRQDLAGDPAEEPASYQVSSPWRELLESASGWRALLLLGVARAHTGDADGALTAWRASIVEQPTAGAWRSIGCALASTDPVAALAAYERAVELAPELPQLLVERLAVMERHDTAHAVLAAVDALPTRARSHPSARLFEARAAVRAGDVERAAAVLEPGLVLPDLREGSRALEELWREYRALRLATDAGRPVDDQVREQAGAEQLPWVYDFRMRPQGPLRVDRPQVTCCG